MDDPKVGESSTSSLSPKAPRTEVKSRRTAPLQSSAAFLHHLHTDPKSHHITLSSGPGRQVSAPVSSKPARATTLGPIVSPDDTDTHYHKTETGTLHGLGESTLKPRDPLSRTPSSRRNRPSTAPSRPNVGSVPVTASDAANEAAGVGSPGLEQSPRPRELQIPPADEEDESCLATFAREENLSNATDAMSMLSVSPDGWSGASRTGRNRLIGRAGHLSPSSEQPPNTELLRPTAPAPPGSNRDIGWRDFASNYAAGNFDPNRTPQPPIGSISPHRVPSARSSPGTRYPSLHQVADVPGFHPQPTSSDTNSSGASVTTSASLMSGTTQPSSAPSMPSPTRSVSSIGTSASKGVAIKAKSMEAENLPARSKPPLGARLALPSYNMAAATVHMASASSGLNSSSFAPLGAPSPDKELTDPMANFVSTSASQSTVKDPSNSDPSHGSRYPLSRSMSSAVEPDRQHLLQLPTIQASPGQSPFGHPRHLNLRHEGISKSPPSWQRGGAIMPHIPSATAPVEKTIEAAAGDDYFGKNATPPPTGAVSRQTSYTSTSDGSSSQQTVTGPAPTPNPFSTHPDERDEPTEMAPPSDGAVPPSQMSELYEKFGWLPAPVPPQEMARRRALYRFNILHTAPDINFDRIAHMAKLVFASKIVMIALIDGDTQWHKTQAGPSINSEVPRVSSFCAHSILSNNDEPLVVLDTLNDWRFAESPNVTGPPHIRFYAGAPLRTADGFNLGSLCLLDDKPREEFTPRQRLILKEFAAIAMREMELWRDKLQLRVRDRIQTSMEKFTRECLEMDAGSADAPTAAAAKMDTIWNRAAALSCSTLDMEECTILDLSSFELTSVETPDGPKSVYRADPYNTDSEVLERSAEEFGGIEPLPILASTNPSRKTVALSARDHEKMSEFLRDARDGRIYEHKPPSWISSLFPEDLVYAMVIPVFGINQQAFTLICAHTTKASKQYLEGYELQFLRAIGVILLSAVLRRRMVLADKAKSILISSVSHELRTPLHGILAAAELLSDTDLDQNQVSFLRTVQSCGNSLIETVNHVLDFTKLSGGNSSQGGKSLKLSKVNLATLIEQTVEGCWVGQRARTFLGDADVGSYYAPDAQPKSQRPSSGASSAMPVEIVVDIAHREKGWNVRCEKGGLRRVLMNLIGNSLKFTKEGYIQVTLRELPHESGSKTIPLEMAVIDTGKGIGKEFLKEQLFHPFSQENPLQTGTGLGLAIVNSIVRSEDVNGKVDVWSSEGMGTEIRVSLDVEVLDEEEDSSSSVSSVSAASSFGSNLSVSLIGFDPNHRGHALSLDVLSSYACSWHFDIKETGDIIIVHEDESLIQAHMDDGKPIIFLTGTRRGEITSLASKISKIGGFFHIVYKPIGPSGLRHALQAAVYFLESPPDTVARPAISRGSSGASEESTSTISELSSLKHKTVHNDRVPLQRRRSEETEQLMSTRPTMAPRGLTYHHGQSASTPRRVSSNEDDLSPSMSSPSSTMSTISLADGGVLLKAAAQPAAVSRRTGTPRVLVVEDNVINRRVLGAFLKKRGYEWAEAYHGAEGVEVFQSTPPNHWDVILMDISMPIMNGHDATRAIRRIEAQRRKAPESTSTTPSGPGIPGVSEPLDTNTPMAMAKIPTFTNRSRAKIFALTGLATPEDKSEAFRSGVDGYLVKPVSLASLDQIFKRIGFA